jgi:trimeric autotransporter adhesin
MNYGTFERANGLAFNAALRLNRNMQFNGGIGYGPDEKVAGGRVGLRVGWRAHQDRISTIGGIG